MAEKVGEISRQANTPRGVTTLVQIARRLRVAPSTVSLALRGSPGVGAEKRELIKMVAKQMDYRPSASARALRGQRTRTVGVVFGSEGQISAMPLFRSYASAIHRISTILMTRHYHMALVTGGAEPNGDSNEHTARMFQEAMVDSLLVIHQPSDRLSKAVETLGVPWVLMDAPVEERKNVVCVDERRAAEQAVKYLVGQGHRAIANLTGIAGNRTWRGTEFTQGYIRGMAAAGLPIMPGWDEHEEVAAYLDILWERRQPPSALITYDDYEALRVITNWLRQHDLAVPDQVSVVALLDIGYGDDGGLGLPRITCKANLQEKMADVAMSKLFAMMTDPATKQESVVLEPELVIRESSGPTR